MSKPPPTQDAAEPDAVRASDKKIVSMLDGPPTVLGGASAARFCHSDVCGPRLRNKPQGPGMAVPSYKKMMEDRKKKPSLIDLTTVFNIRPTKGSRMAERTSGSMQRSFASGDYGKFLTQIIQQNRRTSNGKSGVAPPVLRPSNYDGEGSRRMSTAVRLSTLSERTSQSIRRKSLYGMLLAKCQQYRQIWSGAIRKLMVFNRCCKTFQELSLEVEAHMKTFADIGDDILESNAGQQSTNINTLLQRRRDKEVYVSTKAQFILTMSPEHRTTEQISTVLCDLQAIEGFCNYPLAIQEKICRYGTFQQIGRKRVIIRQGHVAETWYYVLNGQAMVTEIKETDEGKPERITHMILARGMSFGERGLVNNGLRTCTVTSRRPMQLLTMTKEMYKEVFRSALLIDHLMIPDHIAFLTSLPFMVHWPWKNLMQHPSQCTLMYCRKGLVLCRNSIRNKYIYAVKSGSCAVYQYVPSTRASWRDIQLCLAHPTINIDGWPESRVDAGEHQPRRKAAYTLYNRLSARDLVESDMVKRPYLMLGPTYGDARDRRCSKPRMTPTDSEFHEARSRLPQLPGYARRGSAGKSSKRKDWRRKASRTESDEDFIVSSTFQMDSTCDVRRGSVIRRKLLRRRKFKGNVESSTELSQSGHLQRMGKRGSNEVAPLPPDWRRGSLKEPQFDSKLASRETSESDHSFSLSINLESTMSLPDHIVKASLAPNANLGNIVESEENGKTTSLRSSSASPRRSAKASHRLRLRTLSTSPLSLPLPLPRLRSRSRARGQKTCYKTRKPPVYVRIAVIGEGEVFGLDQLNSRDQETEDTKRGSGVVLISDGAEVVMLSKRFFKSYINPKTEDVIRETRPIYPSEGSVQARLRLDLAWQLWQKKTVDEFLQDVKQKGRKHGLYFDEPAFVDPVACLRDNTLDM